MQGVSPGSCEAHQPRAAAQTPLAHWHRLRVAPRCASASFFILASRESAEPHARHAEPLASPHIFSFPTLGARVQHRHVSCCCSCQWHVRIAQYVVHAKTKHILVVRQIVDCTCGTFCEGPAPANGGGHKRGHLLHASAGCSTIARTSECSKAMRKGLRCHALDYRRGTCSGGASTADRGGDQRGHSQGAPAQAAA